MSHTGHLVHEFNAITEHFSPRVIAIANGQYVKLAKFKGEFPFHAHADEDEFFLVHRGEFTMCYRDREVVVKAGAIPGESLVDSRAVIMSWCLVG